MYRTYLRSVTEITGYIVNGYFYCINCIDHEDEKDAQAICLGDQWDYSIACCECGEVIDVEVIEY